MNSADPFEAIVSELYEPLYRFALSLTRAEPDAQDLTQHTFYVWATKGHQLRDQTKVKTWLFTTMHRAFIVGRRKQNRYPHCELEDASLELPSVSFELDRLDAAQVLSALARVDEIFQPAVALFYLEDCSYKEIAAILEVPVGTVKSRIARGLGQLREILSPTEPARDTPGPQIPGGKTRPEIPEPTHLSTQCGQDGRTQVAGPDSARSYTEWDLSSTLVPEPLAEF